MQAVTAVKEARRGDGFFDQVLGAHLVSVMAGFYNWSRSEDVAFSTTLGSCMSVCAYDPGAGVGGMNHFLLPEAPANEENNSFSQSFRYGSAAIEVLLNALYKHGAAKNGLRIKIFGGGKVMNALSYDVGAQNIEFTKNFFERENMRIESEDIGGLNGRRVVFFPRSGKVLIKAVGEKKDLMRIAEKETKILKKLSQEKEEDNIELF